MNPPPCRRPPRAAPCLLLPLLLSACGGPTYRADRLEEHVRDICRREYKFDATARLVGKTLYASIAPQHLVSADLGLDRKTVERLYDALLTVTRVAMSTDAKVDYLVVKAKDANTGVVVTLIRYVPDIKYYFYMRISRNDFDDRGVMEIDNSGEADDPAGWRDLTLEEFMARLSASRLQQKITYNPLVSVFVRVHHVKGAFKEGVLTLRMDKFERLGLEEKEGEEAAGGADEILKRIVVDKVGDVLQKYDDGKLVQRIKVVEEKGRVMFDFPREELLAARRALPKRKWGLPED